MKRIAGNMGQLENADVGNIYHEVLEVFSHCLKEHGYTWLDFPKEEGEQLLREALENCSMRYGETILYSSARYQYMIERMYRILKRTIWALKEQLKSGKFLPEAFEMSFSRVENLDAVNITLSEEEKIKLEMYKIYYAQHEYCRRFGCFAKTAEEAAA